VLYEIMIIGVRFAYLSDCNDNMLKYEWWLVGFAIMKWNGLFHVIKKKMG